MKRYILALDEGTTSARTLLYDVTEHSVKAMVSREIVQSYPQDGWVEEDAEQIWAAQLDTLREAVQAASISCEDIACVGITNQRETVVAWDAESGKPLCPAIVWQCRRTAPLCETLKRDGWAERIYEKTGLVIDAYFSGTKIKWMMDHVPGVAQAVREKRARFGTIDTWLIWNLTNGNVFATDCTNASRTMLFNIHTLAWDDELLALMGIPKDCLPEVLPSSGVAGWMSAGMLGAEIPISGIAGDQQSALFGQACLKEGMAKNTYGTGCFILLNTGSKPVRSQNGLLTTIAWHINGHTTYALEGSVFNAGSTIQWLRDELNVVSSAPEASEIAACTPDSGGVYIVPAFTGLGAPYWDMYARGIICGLTRATGRKELARAAIESIAYQSYDVFEAMRADSGIGLREIRADGGACASDALMEFQAGLLGIRVLRPQNRETTAMGACFLAGLGAGVFADMAEIEALWHLERAFAPTLDEERKIRLLRGWRRAVERARGE